MHVSARPRPCMHAPQAPHNSLTCPVCLCVMLFLSQLFTVQTQSRLCLTVTEHFVPTHCAHLCASLRAHLPAPFTAWLLYFSSAHWLQR